MRLRTFPAILIASALLTSCRDVDVVDERGMTALMRAARRGDTTVMHRLLADGADVNARVPRRDVEEIIATFVQEELPPSDVGFTPLLYAAKSGQARAAKMLIDQGADVHYVGRYLETALGFAVKRSDIAMTRLLTAAGARVHPRQFAEAVEQAPAEMVVLLLQAGGDPNGMSPVDPMRGRHAEQPLLITATRRGDPQVVKALINARVNVNVRDGNAWSALRWARDAEAQRSNPRAREIVALLEAAGARDDGGLKAATLFEAVEKKNLARVHEALRLGANPNARDKRSLTPIITAAYNGSSAIVAALAASGAHVNLIPAHFGPTALTAAIENGSIETVKALLGSGAKPDAVDGRGWSPLFVATSRRRSEIVTLLLADSTKVDGWALRQAANNGDTAIVRMFLQRGGDPNGGAALYAAISGCQEADNTPIIRMLLQAGATTKNRNGLSVLPRAASRCPPEALRLILKHGADPDEPDFAGSAPLFYAVAAGKVENVRVLIAAGADLDATDRQGRTLEQRAWRHPLVRQELKRVRDSLRTRSQ